MAYLDAIPPNVGIVILLANLQLSREPHAKDRDVNRQDSGRDTPAKQHLLSVQDEEERPKGRRFLLVDGHSQEGYKVG